MACAMCSNLGESKFKHIQNELSRGKAPLPSRKIHPGLMGSFRESSDTFLAMQLTRLRNTWLWTEWEGNCIQ
jgi:hypothetical protein